MREEVTGRFDAIEECYEFIVPTIVPTKLTRVAPRQTMLTMVRWSRALASLLVVVAVMTSTLAACVEGASASATEQMACCKAGHDHCPMRDSAADCCKKSGPQSQSRATIVKAASFGASMPVAIPWATLSAVLSVDQTPRHVSYDSSPPGLLLAPPAYIAFSGLLI